MWTDLRGFLSGWAGLFDMFIFYRCTNLVSRGDRIGFIFAGITNSLVQTLCNGFASPRRG